MMSGSTAPMYQKVIFSIIWVHLMITWRHVPRKQACSLTLAKVRECFRAAAIVQMKFRSVLNFQTTPSPTWPQALSWQS